jgi:hypothetical protein
MTTPIIVKTQQKYVTNPPVELLPPESQPVGGLKGHFPYDLSSILSYQAVVGHLYTLVGMS